MASLLAQVAYRYLSWTAPTRCPLPTQNGQLPPQTPPITFPLFVYSHRGGDLERDVSGKRFVENTLSAFRNSAAIGVDLLELDVQLTRDGRAAVFHDKELGRLAGRAFHGKTISEFDYADLPRLQISGQRTTADAQDLNFTRIPLLEEVFAAFPDKAIQIDLKVPSQQLVRVVSDLVAHYGRERLILWGSFLHSNNSGLYTANPRIPLFTSAPRALLLLAAYCAGRLHDVHVYESAIIIPRRLPLSHWLRPSLVLPGFFRDLNARGVSVILYGGINDEAAFQECTAAGANALCTDHPSRLLRWLATRRGDGAATAAGGGANSAEAPLGDAAGVGRGKDDGGLPPASGGRGGDGGG
ncbi:Lysophospholipase D gdpd1 [Pleodorina starrii]|uniref:glycerophosphodiester phosphodiesterase n=1 Tax=Pleodorina starrii TaxID=330485 RepID=A0A9W6C0B2_9CHLO|nr:Lysophospholipase D gdpd1 [Pleodorina starrii]GLC61130.1 Lysophospholipase D gdpd1 [Pleodorina starrii]GLC69542.1 Lysophospholipase D gdpd1 [Pleodorina starrii]